MDDATRCERCFAPRKHPLSKWCSDCWPVVTNNGKYDVPKYRRCPMWLPRHGGWRPRSEHVWRVAVRRERNQRQCAHCDAPFAPVGKRYSMRSTYCDRCFDEYKRCERAGDMSPFHASRVAKCACGNVLPTSCVKFCPDCRPGSVETRTCIRCGDGFVNAMGGREHCRTCSPPGSHAPSEARREMWRRKNRRRRLAKLRAGEAGMYTLAEIAERDKRRCHLCGRLVNMSLSGMDPQGPTIDHLVPQRMALQFRLLHPDAHNAHRISTGYPQHHPQQWTALPCHHKRGTA